MSSLTENDSRPIALSLSRWGSMVVSGCVAAATMAFVFTTWPEVLAAVLECNTVTFRSVAFVVLAALVHSGWGRLPAFLGLKHFLTYPPLWVAGVLGAAGLLYGVAVYHPLQAAMRVPENDTELLGLVAWRGFAGGLIAACLVQGLMWLATRLKNKRSAVRDQARHGQLPLKDPMAMFESWDKLHAWLVQDAAVEDAANDVFGHHEIARRIATRLNARYSGQSALPSQALVGALGSGKTTVRQLVKRELGPKLRLVPVDLWPYHTPEAAVEGVLRSLIEAVAKEVNVVAVRGLPASYLRAMGSAGSLSGAVPAWLIPPPILSTHSNASIIWPQ